MKRIILFGFLFLMLTASALALDSLEVNETYESNSVANWTVGVASSTDADYTGTYGMLVHDDGNAQVHNLVINSTINQNFTAEAWYYENGAGPYGALSIGKDANNLINFRADPSNSRISLWTGGSNINGLLNSSCSLSASNWYRIRADLNRTSSANKQYIAYMTIYGTGGSIVCTSWLHMDADDANATWVDDGSYRVGTWNNNVPGTHYYDLVTFTHIGAGAPPAPSNFTVTAKDIEGTSINNFSINVNGTVLSTTTGTITTNIEEDSGSVDVVVYNGNNSFGSLFNKTYSSHDTAGNLEAELYQVEFTIAGHLKFSNASINGPFSINGAPWNTTNRIMAGEYNISNTNTSYYQKDLLTNISALFNGTVRILDIYDVLVTLRMTNAYTGQNVTSFSGYVYHNATDKNETFNVTNVTGTVGVISGNYQLFAMSPGYSLTSANYKQQNLTNTTESVVWNLYSKNSIRVYIYDEVTSLQITGTNISITLTGNASENTYYTTTGEYFFNNLTDGNYSLKFAGGNYTLKTYQVTVADFSTQVLNAYLSTNTSDVIFTITDYDSASPIEGASMTMSRLINSSWTVVGAKTSDLTGRVALTYLPNVKYRFSVSQTGYTTREFDLDPVLFSSYTVRLSKVTTLDDDDDYLGVFVTWTPKTFYANQSNSFTWQIYSGDGALENYEYNLTYPGGQLTGSGSNALGQNFYTPEFNITDTATGEYINLTYCYKSTLGASARCYSTRYNIEGVYGAYSWVANKNNTFGMDLWLRVLIATLVVVVVAGLITFVAGAIPGVAVGLILWGLFAFQGFIPLWGILPSIFVGFVLIAGSRT